VNFAIRIPILNSFQTRNNISKAKLSLKNAEIVDKSTRITLQQNVEQAFLNMTATFNRYKTLLEQVNAFSESFRGVEARFNEGVLNSVDYLVAKNNLDRANTSLITARYEYVFRTRILDYYQGKPLW
jgi:outer membrane protein